MRRTQSPLGALARGLAAGLVGTAVMTAYQTAVSLKRGSSLKDAVAPDPPEHWKEAPTPGQVGYRFLHGMFEKDVSPNRSTIMTNVVHWLYGTGWGGVYGLAEASIASPTLVAGSAFGSLVFANAYAALPAMGLYKPPWKYDAKTLGVDWSYHLVYGVATAVAFRALQPRSG